MKMKMKTKKSGVFAALAVVLLLAAALITGCPDPLSPGSFEAPDDKPDFQAPPPPPSGMSYVKLNFGDSIGRTIMPKTTLSDFTSFELSIFETDTPTNTITVSNPYTLSQLQAASFTVTAGKSYTVVVNAYIDTAVAATGEDEFNAVAGGTTDLTIPLTITGTGAGTFSWNITYGGTIGDLSAATLDIKTLTGTAVGSQINLKSNASGTNTTINKGFYYIVVTLTRTDYVPVVYTDVLHIYQGMTSEFGNATTPKNFPALSSMPTYTVTFNNTTAPSTGTVTISSYTHGGVLNAHASYTGGTLPAAENIGVGFEGWYTTSTFTSTTKVALASKVFQNLTLYGKWYVAPAAPTLTVDVTFNPMADEAEALTLTGNIVSITKTDLNSTGGVSLSVSSESLTTAGATFVKWIIGDFESTTNSITLKYGNNEDLDTALAGNSVNIMLQVTIGGNPYSKIYPVSLVP